MKTNSNISHLIEILQFNNRTETEYNTVNLNSNQKANPLLVKKIFHRRKNRIGLFFDYDIELISIIKKFSQSTYGNTRKCWYLPYTQKSYEHFKALSIPYILEKTSERRTQEAAKNLDKAPIATKVAPPSVKEKDGGNPEADIISTKKRTIDVLKRKRKFAIRLLSVKKENRRITKSKTITRNKPSTLLKHFNFKSKIPTKMGICRDIT